MNLSEHLNNCVDACRHAHDACKTTFYQHCLEEGGKHLDPRHLSLMIDCMESCHIAANMILRQSAFHMDICAVCADICDACAESCDQIGTDEMLDCARICRICAAACRQSANGMVTHESALERPESSHGRFF